MTVDREARGRLVDLAEKATDVWWYKADSCDYGLENIDPEKARFIAAADPQTVLALLADLDALAKQLNSSARLAHAFQHSTAVRFENCSDAACVNAAAALAEHGDVP